MSLPILPRRNFHRSVQQGHFLVFRLFDVEIAIHPPQRRTDPVNTELGLFRDAAVGHRRIVQKDIEHVPIGVIEGSSQGVVQKGTTQFQHRGFLDKGTAAGAGQHIFRSSIPLRHLQNIGFGHKKDSEESL